MSAAIAVRPLEESEYDGILARAARAVELARTAAANVSDVSLPGRVDIWTSEEGRRTSPHN